MKISESEISTERAILRPLRVRHSREIFYAGIAAKTLNTKSRSNKKNRVEPLSEATLFYPLRRKLGDLALVNFRNLQVDIGLTTMETFTETSDTFAIGRANDHSYAIQVGRLDPTEHGFKSASYTLGVSLDDSVSRQLDVDRLLPVDDFTTKDIEIVSTMLNELSMAAQNSRILDQSTLGESNAKVGPYALSGVDSEVYSDNNYDLVYRFYGLR